MILTVNIRSKSYIAANRTLPVLGNIQFSLHEREILAVVGPSGCGKTTLLKLIGGLDSDFDGDIIWGTKGPPRIGTVFQEPRLLPWRTVRQNIDLVLPRGDHPDAEDLLNVLGLEHFKDAYPKQLSLGMARRAAIARAFAIGPEIVLLDEPFVSLDSAMAERGRGVLLAAWNRQPTAALLVTHDLVEAASLADRIVILSSSPAHVIADIPVPKDDVRAGGETAVRIAEQLRRIVVDSGRAAEHAAR